MMKRMPVWMRPILADKRKLSVMGALVAVMLILWGRLLLAPAPHAAGAAMSQLPDSDATATLATDLTAGDANAYLDPLDYPVVRVDLPGELSRDVFALKADRYERLKPVVTTAGIPKSQVEVVDAMPEAELVRRAARGLTLQTTVVGQTPRAMINGQLLAPGEKVGGFELLEVRERNVVMLMRGIRIELGM